MRSNVAKQKVLLIDDSELALAITSAVLGDAGFEVRTSTEVYALQAVVGSWRPDVIVTDINMPGISGIELCRLLKASYETADVPIVLFSGIPLEELDALARECGAEAFVTKASIEQLPSAVADAIQASVF